MLIAFNNDLEFRSRWYHIQTEDNGIKDGHITTTVFYSGQILDSKSASYLDAIASTPDPEQQNRIIKAAMSQQHKRFCTKLLEGTYENIVNNLSVNKSGHNFQPVPVATKSPSQTDMRPAQAASAAQLHKSERAHTSAPSPSLPSISSSNQPAVKIPAPAAFNATANQLKRHPSPENKRLSSRQASKSRAYRGVIWPDTDLSIDTIVADLIARPSV